MFSRALPIAAWALLLIAAVSCTSCGGGAGGSPGATAAPNPAQPGASLPSLPIDGARRFAAANGVGNSQASLSVIGVISGRVTKAGPNGSILPDPAATISTDQGAFSARTDADGNFTLPVPASYYTLIVSSPGFRTRTVRDVPAIADQATVVTTVLLPLVPLDATDEDRTNPAHIVAKAYVGAGRCRACHTTLFDAFGGSRHRRIVRFVNDPSDAFRGDGIVADFAPDPGSNVKTIRLEDRTLGQLTIQLRKTADNRYFADLLDRSGGGTHTYEILRAQGGTGKFCQRFHTRIGGDWYTLPVEYNELDPNPAARWAGYNVADWFDARGDVRIHAARRAGQDLFVRGPDQSASYERKCYGCHGQVQGISRVDESASLAGEGDVGDYVLDATALRVTCENCHGPGYPHVETRSPEDIVNPSKNALRSAKLPFERANDTCGQCHAGGHSLYTAPAVMGVVESPADRRLEYTLSTAGRSFQPGANLLATALDISGTAKYWNQDFTRNNVSFDNRGQYLDHIRGAHSFAEASVTCFDCHDPHGDRSAGRPSQLLASADDNSLCLACHGKDGRAKSRYLLPGETSPDRSVRSVSLHTKHSYDPAGTSGPVSGRCVACHMPRTASNALRFDVALHSQRIIKPVESLDMLDGGGDKGEGLVVPHSCANPTVGCHTGPAAPGGDYFAGPGDLRGNAAARARLVAAVNAFESKFGTRKSTGTDVAGQLGAVSGTVTLGGLPVDGARVMADRGEDFDETGEDGKFRLAVPKGTYNLFAVHPSLETTSLEAVTVVSGAVNGGLRLTLDALPATRAQFVGSQKCKTCHAGVYENWQKTLHDKGIRYADANDDRDPRFTGILGDFGPEGVGRTIRSTESDFSALGAAEIRLERSGGVYSATLVNADSSVLGTFTVFRTYGGGRGDWRQTLAVHAPGGTYLLPIEWSEFGPPGTVAHPRWKAYDLANWFDGSRFHIPQPDRSYETQCSACHATGFKASPGSLPGSTLTKFTEMNAGCESCHGPAGAHYRTGDPAKIVNPDKLATAQLKLDVCSRCHQGGNPPDSRFWSAETYTVTTPTADPTFKIVADQPLTAIRHHETAAEYAATEHFTAGVECWSCHRQHGNSVHANLVTTDGNLIVNEQVNEKSLCLRCHGPSGSATKKFTSVEKLRNHFRGGIPSHEEPAIEARFTCTGCHMSPAAQTAEKYDIHSHTFQAVDPQVSLDMGLAGGGDTRIPRGTDGNNADPSRRGRWNYDRTAVLPNACTGCHASRLNSVSALKTGVVLFNFWKSQGGGVVE